MTEHIDSIKTYTLVLLALLALTVATTLVAFVDLGGFSVVVALAIAVCKMLLVALYFMHVRHSTKLTKLVVLGGLLWLAILLMLTLTDFTTRDGSACRAGRCSDQLTGSPELGPSVLPRLLRLAAEWLENRSECPRESVR